MKANKSIDKARKQLAEWIDASANDDQKVSINAAARGMGTSATTLSQFLAGKYPGDNKKVAARVAGWLRRQAERKNVNEVFADTIRTRAVHRVMGAARVCHIEGEIGAVTGEAGSGKTRGVRLYAAQNPDVILVEVIPGFTAKTLVSSLHRQCGYDGRGTIYDMFVDITGKLQGSGRLIIIDEAENLPYKALELMRRVHDIAGVGILLVGMPELIVNLRGNKGEFRQLYSRVGVHSSVPELDAGDVKALVDSALPSSNGVHKDFYNATRNGRALGKLIKRAMQVADRNDGQVDGAVVKEAKKYIII